MAEKERMMKMRLKKLHCILQHNNEPSLFKGMLCTTHCTCDNQVTDVVKVPFLSLAFSLKNLNVAILSDFSCRA